MSEAEALQAVRGIAGVSRLLVALDFDGTLAPTVDDPEEARAVPDALRALETLSALPATTVALVSGRSLGGLQAVASAPPAIVLVGSHGAEVLIDGEVVAPELAGDEQSVLGELCELVEGVAAQFPGARVERKPYGCGLHTRLSSSGDAESAREKALEGVRRLGPSANISQRYGKDILEFTVRHADKGSALTLLRERTGASAVIFVGDDVTDEDGFRALGAVDVGIKVGSGDTAASFRVESPESVARLLGALAEARSG